MPTSSAGPGRNAANMPKGENFNTWLSNQITALNSASFDANSRDIIAKSVYDLGGDPISLASVSIALNLSKLSYKSSDCWFNINEFVNGYDAMFQDKIQLERITDAKEKKIFIRKLDRIKKEPFFIVVGDNSHTFDNLRFLFPLTVTNIGQSYTDSCYWDTDSDDDFCLLGCLKRCYRERGLILSIDRVTQQFIGTKRDQETGEIVAVHLDNALKLCVCSAGSESETNKKDAA